MGLWLAAYSTAMGVVLLLVWRWSLLAFCALPILAAAAWREWRHDLCLGAPDSLVWISCEDSAWRLGTKDDRVIPARLVSFTSQPWLLSLTFRAIASGALYQVLLPPDGVSDEAHRRLRALLR